MLGLVVSWTCQDFLKQQIEKIMVSSISKATICFFQKSWLVQLTTNSNTHLDDNPSSMQVKLYSYEAKCNVPLHIYPFLALWYDILDFTLCLSTGLQSSVILLPLVSFFFFQIYCCFLLMYIYLVYVTLNVLVLTCPFYEGWGALFISSCTIGLFRFSSFLVCRSLSPYDVFLFINSIKLLIVCWLEGRSWTV